MGVMDTCYLFDEETDLLAACFGVDLFILAWACFGCFASFGRIWGGGVGGW